MMDNRQLTPWEFGQLVEAMREATHEDMGTLTVHTGVHPDVGEIVILTSRERDAVLIHQ
jgi:hypothetical protein